MGSEFVAASITTLRSMGDQRQLSGCGCMYGEREREREREREGGRERVKGGSNRKGKGLVYSE